MHQGLVVGKFFGRRSILGLDSSEWMDIDVTMTPVNQILTLLSYSMSRITSGARYVWDYIASFLGFAGSSFQNQRERAIPYLKALVERSISDNRLAYFWQLALSSRLVQSAKDRNTVNYSILFVDIYRNQPVGQFSLKGPVNSSSPVCTSKETLGIGK